MISKIKIKSIENNIIHRNKTSINWISSKLKTITRESLFREDDSPSQNWITVFTEHASDKGFFNCMILYNV